MKPRLTSVGISAASFWRPSRGPTSTIVTDPGSGTSAAVPRSPARSAASRSTSGWPRCTWSPTATWTRRDATGRRGGDHVLHLHRLEDHAAACVARRGRPRVDVDAHDPAGHRGRQRVRLVGDSPPTRASDGGRCEREAVAAARARSPSRPGARRRPGGPAPARRRSRWSSPTSRRRPSALAANPPPSTRDRRPRRAAGATVVRRRPRAPAGDPAQRLADPARAATGRRPATGRRRVPPAAPAPSERAAAAAAITSSGHVGQPLDDARARRGTPCAGRPPRNAGSSRTAASRSTLVATPSIRVASSASTRRRDRRGTIRAVGDDLGQQRVVERRHRTSRRRRPCRRGPVRAGRTPSRRPSRAGTRPRRPRPRPAAPSRGRRAARRPARTPAARRPRRAAAARRGRGPVTASVTGCSTWRRALTSRKKNAPVVVEQELDRPGVARTRRPAPAAAPPRPSPPGAPADTAGDGDSSISFWCRRWTLHSRSPRWTSVPCASPRIWTSTCRGRSRYRSRSSRSSPNAAAASRRAAASASASSAGLATTRIPRPPPPALALTSSGYPIRPAAARRASSLASSPW